MRPHALLPVALSLVVAGCTIGPDYVRPPSTALSAPASFADASTPSSDTGFDLASWWRTFDDPELDALIRRADIDNTDLAAAVARIGVAKAALYPALRLTRSLNSAAGSLVGLPVNAITALVGGLSARGPAFAAPARPPIRRARCFPPIASIWRGRRLSNPSTASC